jgi:hypothetical protein
MKVVSICRTTISALMAVCLSTTLGAQSESLQARVAALKESLTQSREQLKQYEWVETTVVLQNGEEKSTKQYRAHYGADGTVQKTLLETSPEKEGRGLRGHIIEKEEGGTDRLHAASSGLGETLRAAQFREDPGREGRGQRFTNRGRAWPARSSEFPKLPNAWRHANN